MPDRIVAATSVCLAAPPGAHGHEIRRALSTAVWRLLRMR